MPYDAMPSFMRWALPSIATCIWWGMGFQNIQPLAFVFLPLALLYARVRVNCDTCLPDAAFWSLWATFALGIWLAFMGVFNDPYWSLANVLSSLAVSLAVSLSIALPFWLDVAFLRKYGHDCCGLVFPTAFTSAWFVWSRLSPIGAFGHIAYTQLHCEALIQLAALCGVHGIAFVLGWWSSALLAFLLAPGVDASEQARCLRVQACRPGKARLSVLQSTEPMADASTHYGPASDVRRFFIVFGMLLLYGGARPQLSADTFYQRSVGDVVRPTVPVVCLFAQVLATPEPLASRRAAWADALNRTSAAASRTGARILLWSEESLAAESEGEEAELVGAFGQLARAHDAFIGITFRRSDGSESGVRNMMVLLSADGHPCARYQKAHPVPGVELGVIAGSAELQTCDDPKLGIRYGVAICFDLDFPEFIGQASAANVDVLLQASWVCAHQREHLRRCATAAQATCGGRGSLPQLRASTPPLFSWPCRHRHGVPCEATWLTATRCVPSSRASRCCAALPTASARSLTRTTVRSCSRPRSLRATSVPTCPCASACGPFTAQLTMRLPGLRSPPALCCSSPSCCRSNGCHETRALRSLCPSGRASPRRWYWQRGPLVPVSMARAPSADMFH